MHTAKPEFIIAIGASAGGMDEINIFFDHTPLDSVAYVIVQHLSADFKSRMVELLARHSKLVVQEAQQDMAISPNEVYLIPNNQFMTVSGGRLQLTPKEAWHAPHLTINAFLTSLAADYGPKSIGVILSGLGTDGTEGATAIKKAGGMLIARNPETTAYGSMPSSAIATGLVDFILEPAAMPGIIEQYAKNGLGAIAEYKADEASVSTIIDILKDQTPMDFSDYKETTISRRIKRRAAAKNFTTLEKYIDFLKATPDEVNVLAKDFLISVTSFFRDEEAFRFLQENVLPEMVQKASAGEELKLWVAGCATGEEAYSLAILLHEQFTGQQKEPQVKIFATDVDREALLYARNGVYKQELEKVVSPERLERYFIKEDTHYRVKPEIRRMVVFAQHDLVKNPPYCNMDMISCRNVLIYMASALQKRIFSMLLFGLKKGGYLFLGSSENPMSIIQNLEVVDKKHKIYRNMEATRMVRFDAFSLPQALEGRQKTLALRESSPMHTAVPPGDTISDILARDLDVLAICVDENNQVLRSYGDTGRYLLQKNFTLHLPDLMTAPLAVAFNSAVRAAAKTNELSTVSGIRLDPSSPVPVTIAVRPLAVRNGEPRSLLVIISRDKTPGEHPGPHVVFDERIHLDQYILNLEEELKEMKEKLNVAYEKLDASYENMQSFNEELLSANEEMQSTNEELQSVNEELHTINADYQLKNKELGEMNDDLNNYFRSNINGQLFVGKDLSLMKYSPVTATLINLRESDIGRPIGNISTNLKFDTVIEDIKTVITHGTTIERDIEAMDGRWYQISSMPYIKQVENEHSGAVITFTDITTLKNTQHELLLKNNSLQRVNSDLDNFINTASHDLLGPLGSIESSITFINGMDTSDPEFKMFLNVINTSIRKFRSLITDIATIGRVEGGMLLMETVDVNEVLDDLEWALEDKIAASGAVIERNIAAAHLDFSRKNFRSILYNLISNAIKYRGEDEPLIKVSTRKEHEHVIVTVTDNGIGINAKSISKIFEAYGRLQHDIEGQGIGLYLAKKIVDAAGGNITVESEPGKGSTFTLSLKVQ